MLRGPSLPVSESNRFTSDPLPAASSYLVLQAYPEGLSSADIPQPLHVPLGEHGHKIALVLFSASSGGCGPGAFLLCDQGVTVA